MNAQELLARSAIEANRDRVLDGLLKELFPVSEAGSLFFIDVGDEYIQHAFAVYAPEKSGPVHWLFYVLSPDKKWVSCSPRIPSDKSADRDFVLAAINAAIKQLVDGMERVNA